MLVVKITMLYIQDKTPPLMMTSSSINFAGRRDQPHEVEQFRVVFGGLYIR